MPVLPLVGSTMVAPGLSFPSRSAASIMLRQILSLTEPPGFCDSSLAQSSASFLLGTLRSRTAGVEPIRSRTERAPFMFATTETRFEWEEIAWNGLYAIVPEVQSQLNSGVGGAEKALAIFPGALGDFVCFLPALVEIARGRAVDLLARAEVRGLVPPAINVMSLERLELARLFVAGADLGEAEEFFRRYAAVYSWH